MQTSGTIIRTLFLRNTIDECKIGRTTSATLKFTQTITNSMPQTLIDIKEDLRGKVLVHLFRFCPWVSHLIWLYLYSWKREDNEDHALHKILKSLETKRVVIDLLTFPGNRKSGLLEKWMWTRSPSDNFWVSHSTLIRWAELATQMNHIKCLGAHAAKTLQRGCDFTQGYSVSPDSSWSAWVSTIL